MTDSPSPPSTTSDDLQVAIGRRLRGIRIDAIQFVATDGKEHDKWDILSAVCDLAVGALNAARAMDGLDSDPATQNWPRVTPLPAKEEKPPNTVSGATDSGELVKYGIRKCRDSHWHVTIGGLDDLATRPNALTYERALEIANRLNAGEEFGRH